MNQEPLPMESCEPPAALNVLLWPGVAPKNRVGGSAAFSFVFAFQYIGETLDTPAGNGGCGYDFASGVHKYLYAADDPVNLDDPSGNDYGDFDINMRSIGNLLSTIGAVETAETGLGVFSPERTVTVQSYIAAPYVVGPFGLFAGDNHGPTSSPSSHFRTTSTESFYDYLAGTGSVKSDTGTTIELSPFIPGYVATGKASSAGLTGNETYISSGVARITMNGSASNPLVHGAPPIQYHLMLSINFNTDSFAGSFTRTDFPSFQIFIDNVNVYNYKEVGTAGNLFFHQWVPLSGTFKP